MKMVTDINMYLNLEITLFLSLVQSMILLLEDLTKLTISGHYGRQIHQ